MFYLYIWIGERLVLCICQKTCSASFQIVVSYWRIRFAGPCHRTANLGLVCHGVYTLMIVHSWLSWVFVAFIQMGFRIRESKRHSLCQDNTEFFGLWVYVRGFWCQLVCQSSPSSSPSMPVHCGGDPRGPLLLLGVFLAVSLFVVEYPSKCKKRHLCWSLKFACFWLVYRLRNPFVI